MVVVVKEFEVKRNDIEIAAILFSILQTSAIFLHDPLIMRTKLLNLLIFTKKSRSENRTALIYEKKLYSYFFPFFLATAATLLVVSCAIGVAINNEE